jgi:hypothetical protein
MQIGSITWRNIHHYPRIIIDFGGDSYLVYCIQCGFENKDDAYYCVKCGVSLPLTHTRYNHSSHDCFGISKGDDSCLVLRHGGAIIGMIVGVLIIISGISVLLDQSIWHLFLPLFIIAIGLFLVFEAIFRRKNIR